MSEFTASNGIKLRQSINGVLSFDNATDGWTTICGTDVVTALREFFQKENDDRLGRWRDAKHPDYVVYDNEDGGVWVYSEREPGGILYQSRRNVPKSWSSREAGYVETAHAYFDAHPKPWHDAKPGEVWEIEVDGRTHHARVGYGDFAHLFEFNEDTSMTKRHSAITAGRRIWPEDKEEKR